MARLIYSVIASLDGYIEDESGGFDWAEPDEEAHVFVNDLGVQRPDEDRARLRARGDPEAEGGRRSRPYGRRRRTRRRGAPGRAGRRAPAAVRTGRRRRRQAGAARGVRAPLELLDERRFVSGMVFLRYRVAQ